MENEPSTNPTPDKKSELLNNTPNTILQLLEHSKLHNDLEVQRAMKGIVDMLTSPEATKEQVRQAWITYGLIVENLVDTISQENTQARAQQQIIAIINKAIIFQLTENPLRYLDELTSAETYAFQQGFDDMVTILDEEIDMTAETLALSPELVIIKLRKVLDEDNVEYLKDLVDDGADMEDIIGHVYGMLLEEGKDPESVLTERGIIEK